MRSAYIYTYLIRAYTCQNVHNEPKTPCSNGVIFLHVLHVFARICVPLRTYTCNYMQKYDPVWTGEFRPAVNVKVHIGTYHTGIFYIFICNSYVVARIKKKIRQKIHSRHICMYFDSSRGSFQKLLMCCTHRHYIHVCTSTYDYVCLRTYMDYVHIQS